MQTKKINYQMLSEEESLHSPISPDFELKQSLLKALYRIGLGQDTLLSRHILSASPSLNIKTLSHKTLEVMYFELCLKLNRGPLAKESHPTLYEHKCAKTLRKFSRLKFYQSFWIGNHCVDFYLQRFGLVIEIDGGIHNDETKMKKDNYAEKEFMHLYRLSVSRFNNANLSRLESTVFHLLGDFKKINTKAIRSRNRDIFINTLTHHCSMDELALYLGQDIHKVLDIYKKTRRKKRKE